MQRYLESWFSYLLGGVDGAYVLAMKLRLTGKHGFFFPDGFGDVDVSRRLRSFMIGATHVNCCGMWVSCGAPPRKSGNLASSAAGRCLPSTSRLSGLASTQSRDGRHHVQTT